MRTAALALLLALSACARARPGDVPTIKFGADSCARCGMILSEERFASGWVAADGQSVVYDDVGELLEALRAHPENKRFAFVRDAGDGRWLKASEAYFASIKGLATPMGSGVAAFASEERARSFSGKLGQPITKGERL